MLRSSEKLSSAVGDRGLREGRSDSRMEDTERFNLGRLLLTSSLSVIFPVVFEAINPSMKMVISKIP